MRFFRNSCGLALVYQLRWLYGGGRSPVTPPRRATTEAIPTLGNFDPVMFTRTFNSGHTYVEPWLTVRNKSSRDLGVFLKKCSNFDVTQIDVKVMDPTGKTPCQVGAHICRRTPDQAGAICRVGRCGRCCARQS